MSRGIGRWLEYSDEVGKQCFRHEFMMGGKGDEKGIHLLKSNPNDVIDAVSK